MSKPTPSLKDELANLDLEFLQGVPVHLTEVMTGLILDLVISRVLDLPEMQDEPMNTKREDKWASTPPYKRNQLRAQLRQAYTELFLGKE